LHQLDSLGNTAGLPDKQIRANYSRGPIKLACAPSYEFVIYEISKSICIFYRSGSPLLLSMDLSDLALSSLSLICPALLALW